MVVVAAETIKASSKLPILSFPLPAMVVSSQKPSL